MKTHALKQRLIEIEIDGVTRLVIEMHIFPHQINIQLIMLNVSKCEKSGKFWKNQGTPGDP